MSGDTEVSTVASQRKVAGSMPESGTVLCGLCVFLLCLGFRFSQFFGSSHTPNTFT